MPRSVSKVSSNGDGFRIQIPARLEGVGSLLQNTNQKIARNAKDSRHRHPVHARDVAPMGKSGLAWRSVTSVAAGDDKQVPVRARRNRIDGRSSLGGQLSVIPRGLAGNDVHVDRQGLVS